MTMFKFLSNLLDSNAKEIKTLQTIVDKVNLLEPDFKRLKDDGIAKKTAEFKKRLSSGETLDDLMPEAFALVREAAGRTIGERHYNVQLMAAAALHQGKVAEQKTGEGKTLSATPALYLNALTGRGAHLVTVNDYLARRDAGWMAPIYHMLGMSVSAIISEQSFIYDPEFEDKSSGDWRLMHLKPVSRKEAYLADITYGINSEFEKAYRKQYVPIPHTIPVFTFATSSGMAAMTTAALFIQGETPNDGTILMGKSCYFETKQLINKLFGHRVHEVDLSDTELTRDTCNKYKPVAIFADTLGNEPSMRQVEVSDLVHLASGATRDRVFIVCDPSANTLSATYIKGFTLPKNITLIGIESQNKLLQYGLDRVCAGIVWGTGYISQKLYDYRDHAGTICPDSTIATLPTPNREMAKLYTKRLVRNTEELVSYLRNNAKIKTKQIHVIYPVKSQGVYLILHWRQSLLHSYNRYIHQVVAAAKKSNIQIVHGTSFGLQTTRIYTVAMHTQYSHSFLRISLGSETASQIQTLGELLTKYL